MRFLLPLLPILICFLWIGFYGLDFGTHWDEPSAKFASVKATLQTGIFLQGAEGIFAATYNYGGVNYLLTWAGLAPEVSHFLTHDPFTREALSAAISPILNEHHVRMRVRRIYLLLSALSLVWLYWLCLILGRTRVEAFLAAAILGGSWEFGYHSRWIAPDVVMAQFALLAFLCIAMGLTRKTRRWFDFAAVAAGLATGTKYPGALVVLFVIAAATRVQWQLGERWTSILKRTAKLGGIAFATFVITSPGILIDPFRFVAELKFEREVYATGFFGHTVKPGLTHLLAILKYFFLELFSPYWTVSGLLAVLCVIGLVILGKEMRTFNVLALLFAGVYVFYFSTQGAMLVRNLMVVAPFLCLAAARGIMALSDRIRPRLWWGFATIVGVALLLSYGWQVGAAVTVKFRHHQEDFVSQFTDYVRKSPSVTVLMSAKLSKYLNQYGGQIPQNLTTDPTIPHDKVAFLQSEGADVHWEKWPANWWGMYEATFGAREVNLEAYPTFVGNERIHLTSNRHFERLPLKTEEMIKP